MSATADSLPALARAVLDGLHAPFLERFLAAWPASPHALDVHRAAPVGLSLPVLRFLPHIAADRAHFGAPFVEALCRAAPSLAWRQSYSEREVGGAFLQNYGWCEIVAGARSRTSAQIACGVVVLGPRTLYPPHRHEAEEIYLPLRGTAVWQQGDAVWREHPPGTLIHHLSEEPHAMRTGDEPLLAMYLWYSIDLGQKARLDPRPSV
jgi:quercetin dioxygenase-like cupin family protein